MNEVIVVGCYVFFFGDNFLVVILLSYWFRNILRINLLYIFWGDNNVLFLRSCENSDLALANMRDVALPHLRLHLPICGMLRCRIFSCMVWRSDFQSVGRSSRDGTGSLAKCEEKRSEVKVKSLELSKLISCGHGAKASYVAV